MNHREDLVSVHLAGSIAAALSQLQLLLDSPSVIIFSLDRSYCYTSFNRNHAATMRRIWGADIRIGQCALDVIRSEADRQRARANFDRALAGEEFVLVEEYGEPCLKRTWYEDRYSPMRTHSGEVAGVTVIVSDVSERMLAHEEKLAMEIRLQETARLESLAVLAGGVAHDFNNLLVGVLGAAELMRDRVAPEDPLNGELDLIIESAERAADLTRQLLAYSGRSHLVVAPIDLGALAKDMLPLLDSAAGKKAHLALEVEPSLPAVRADATQLRQILMNLVINAVDALDGGPGSIRIAVEQTETKRGELGVAIVVADDGPGMSEGVRNRIFEPFFSTKAHGRGLGLAAVHGIVRGHGGTIDVDSNVGHGTRFTVRLPAVSDAAEPLLGGSTRSGRRRSLVGRTILVVDDESAVRRVAEQALSRAGARVLVAASGEEGLRRLRGRDRPDLVVLDLTMPGLSGDVFLQVARKEGLEVPIVLSSGYGEPEALARLESMGPLAFLPKPFTAVDLLGRIADVLAD